MRIYNKKSLIIGLLFCLLGLFNLITGWTHDFRIRDMVLIFLLFCIGISRLVRSLSKQCSKEDLLEEKDERNQLVNVKTKAKAFQMMQMFLIITGFIAILYGSVLKDDAFLYIALGLLFLWTLSLVAEFFTFIYYDRRE